MVAHQQSWIEFMLKHYRVDRSCGLQRTCGPECYCCLEPEKWPRLPGENGCVYAGQPREIAGQKHYPCRLNESQ